MTVEKSRRPVLVLATLAVGAIALCAQPAAAFAKPAPVAHKSMAWSGEQTPRDGCAFLPARRLDPLAAAPRGASEGVCDHGDNPMIC